MVGGFGLFRLFRASVVSRHSAKASPWFLDIL